MKSLTHLTKSSARTTSAKIVYLVALFALAFAGCVRTENPGGGTGSTANTNSGSSSSTGSTGTGNNGKRIVVGFSQMENDGPWRIAESRSMEEEAKRRGYEYVTTDARGDTSKQLADIETLINRKVDAIFLAPRERNGLESALQAARDAKIPVFFIDREAEGTPGQDYVAFIGSDFVEEGRRAAEWLATTTNGNAKIVMITGTPNASVAQDRARGFSDEIKKHAGMQIIATQNGEFNRAKAQSTMENIIQAQGSNITAVYTHSDEMALGAINALKSAGRKPGQDVVVVSVDGQKSALQAIVNGELGATVECNPRFGPIAYDTFERFRRGEQVQTKIIIPDRFFDKSNAAQFIDEAY